MRVSQHAHQAYYSVKIEHAGQRGCFRALICRVVTYEIRRPPRIRGLEKPELADPPRSAKCKSVPHQLLTVVSACSHTPPTGVLINLFYYLQRYAPDRVIVGFKSVAQAASNPIPRRGVTLASTDVGAKSVSLYTITDGKSVEDKIAELKQDPTVAWAEPDYIVTQARTPNDPIYPQEWHQPIIGSPKTWDTITSAKTDGVKICHVDSGAQADHPDLVGSISTGWNFVPLSNSMADYPVPRDSAEYRVITDTNGHGTHTAGIIAGTGNNGQGVAGVAWAANLLVCRFIWTDGTGFVSDAASCLSLCRQQGARVSNHSWTSEDVPQVMLDAIAAERAAGALMIVAAGNQAANVDTYDAYPAALLRDPGYDASNIISVTATDQYGQLAWFSNVGKKSVTMAAPGTGIWSTFLNSQYITSDGTSMATPMVTGALALMMAYGDSRGVSLTGAQLKVLLTRGSTTSSVLTNYTITGKLLSSSGAMAETISFLNRPP
ncbi:subtilase, partial [Helicosporidium sp. ATCC 50920]